MKHIYKALLFSFAIVLSFSARAQNYTISPSSTAYLTAEYNMLNESAIYMVNNANTKISLSWTLISNNLAAGWDFSLCDLGTCYPGIPASGIMDSVDVGANGFLSLKVDPYSIAGSGSVTMYVYETQYPSNGDTLTWYITSSPSGINELNELNFNVHPNPSSHAITLSFAGETNAAISIFDVTGRQVMSVVANNDLSKKIDISSLAPGAYYVQCTTASASFTKRIIKN